MRVNWALVCDFDGTATMEDLGDQVSIKFAGHRHWRESVDLFLAGAFSFSALLSRMFEPVVATREEIAAFARARAVLRPGFEQLAAACRDAAWPFVLCSSGLDVYIDPVLERVSPEIRSYMDVRANRAICSPVGMKVEFTGISGCGRCGSCKGPVVEELKAAGHRVIVCGDGTGDRCAADVADFVFARHRLLDHCESRAIPHRLLDAFDDVTAFLLES